MEFTTKSISITPQVSLSKSEAPFSLLKDLYNLSKTVEESLFHFAPINSTTIETAKEFISNLFNLVKTNNLPWIEPHITTKGDGDVCFEWWQNNSLLELTVEQGGNIKFIKACESRIIQKIGMNRQLSNAELVDMWKSLTYNQTVGLSSKPLDSSNQFLSSFNQLFDSFQKN